MPSTTTHMAILAPSLRTYDPSSSLSSATSAAATAEAECGHAIPWSSLFVQQQNGSCEGNGSRRRVLPSCPVCQSPVAYVREQHFVTHSAISRKSSASNTNETSNSNHEEEEDNNASTVYFKYGKIVFRLLVGTPPPTTTRDVDNDNENSNTGSTTGSGIRGILLWWWGWLPGWWSSTTPVTILDTFSSSSSTTAMAGTAQHRIMSVLGISQGMKILHKGKVLFPIATTVTPAGISSSDHRLSFEMQQQQQKVLSQRLIELSKPPTPTTASNGSNSSGTLLAAAPPPVLLVVGTPDDDQQVWLSNERRQQQQQSQNQPASAARFDVWTLVTTATVSDAWHACRWVLVECWWRTAVRSTRWLWSHTIGSYFRVGSVTPTRDSNNDRPHAE